MLFLQRGGFQLHDHLILSPPSTTPHALLLLLLFKKTFKLAQKMGRFFFTGSLGSKPMPSFSLGPEPQFCSCVR